MNEYEKGRRDMLKEVMWMLEHYDYHMSREELMKEIKENVKE